MDKLKEKIMNNEKLTEEEISEFLSYIISSVRDIVNDSSMTNKCDIVQGLVGRYLSKLGIPIFPCNTQNQISKKVTGHSFLITQINDINYLIDPTFIQFKYDKTEDLYIDNLKCKSYSPYYYANMLNKKACEDFIKKGYMQLTEDNAYWYGNSFHKTTINILKDVELTNINGNLYIKSFLKGDEKLKEYNYSEIDEIISKKQK